MDPYFSSDEEAKSITTEDPDQMIEVLHEYFESDECRPYDLSLLPRKNAVARLDPIVRHHYGVKSVSCLPPNPASFEELKRRQVFPRLRRWFEDDFTTYPEYAISNTSNTIKDDTFFPFDFSNSDVASDKVSIPVQEEEEDMAEMVTLTLDEDFFDAFDNEFKDLLLVGEMSDLSVTVTTTYATHFSHGIDSYQRLRTDAENKWKLYAVKEVVEENVQPLKPLTPLPSQIRRSRHVASVSTASSLTSASRDSSSATAYYDARAQYFDEDARFDKNGMTPGYHHHHPVGKVETPMNNYTISALLARAKSMLIDQQTKRNENEHEKTLGDDDDDDDDLINQLQKDSSSPHSLAESSISDEEFAPPAVVAYDNSSCSALSEVSNTSSTRAALSRKDVKVLLNKLEEESQNRRARFGLKERAE